MELNKDLKLTDLIVVKHDVFSEKLCDELINEYQKDEWCEAETLGELNDYRVCKSLLMSHEDRIGNKEQRLQLDKTVFETIDPVIKEYADSFIGHLNYERDEGYTLLKYEPGDFYKEHTDDPEMVRVDEAGNYKPSSLVKRKVTFVVQLNEDFEGGGLSFFADTHRVEVKKGSVILFPSNYMYPHQALPVTKGVRYSLITWIS